jgi:integrase
VPVQARLAEQLRWHIERRRPAAESLLCPGENGEPHVPIRFQRDFYAPAIRAAGLRPMRFHDLRRSFIAQCIAAAIPAAQTASWLGHTVAMMEYYYNAGHAELIAAVGRLSTVGDGL